MNKPSADLSQDQAQESPARFTADEFMVMVAAGLFDDWVGKVELAEGVIVQMSPALSPHFRVQRQLFLKLHAIYGDGIDGFIVGQEPTIRLGPRTVRDPDVAILRDVAPADSVNRATDVHLVAEVAHRTLAKDRGPKKRSYALAGIAHYWIVDVKGRIVELMSMPEGDEYRERRAIAFGEPIPVPGTDATITLD